MCKCAFDRLLLETTDDNGCVLHFNTLHIKISILESVWSILPISSRKYLQSILKSPSEDEEEDAVKETGVDIAVVASLSELVIIFTLGEKEKRALKAYSGWPTCSHVHFTPNCSTSLFDWLSLHHVTELSVSHTYYVSLRRRGCVSFYYTDLLIKCEIAEIKKQLLNAS